MRHALPVILTLAISATVLQVQAQDRHANYYYPEPLTEEVYASFASRQGNASKRTRVGFTVGLNAQQRKRNHAPTYHMFAKGAEGQKLIIVATEAGRYNTLYRLRALLASLSADARATPLFRKLPSPENANFLDLCKLIGFERVTISDGDKLAHTILIK